MSRKILRPLYLLAFIASLLLATAFYSNTNAKKHLQHYHDSGKYYSDISNVIKQATYYLQFRINQQTHDPQSQKLAIVMDIDETALSNYKKLLANNFKIDAKTLKQIERFNNDPAIPHTLALYNYAKDHGVAIFFITGRSQVIKASTVTNLNTAGYHCWDGISFNTTEEVGHNTIPYREQQRKKIKNAGYDIIMNIGNRSATLTGDYADMKFELPNPFYSVS